MTEEMKRLQKEINGKLVWWRSNRDGRLVPALCIWPPNGDIVSVKPYGISPEETAKIIYWRSIEEIARDQYCLVAIKVWKDAEDNFEELKHLEGTPPNGVYNAFAPHLGSHGNNPSCPYG